MSCVDKYAFGRLTIDAVFMIIKGAGFAIMGFFAKALALATNSPFGCPLFTLTPSAAASLASSDWQMPQIDKGI